MRQKHVNAVASNSAKTIILNHDFQNKTLWKLLADNANGRADTESIEIQYIMKNGYRSAQKCPDIYINKSITTLSCPEYINNSHKNKNSIILYAKSTSNNPIIPITAFANMELLCKPDTTLEVLYKLETKLETSDIHQFSIPCLVNSTCYDINNKVIVPDKYNYLHVKIVSGIFLYPHAYVALLYEALLIKEQNNKITTEEISSKERLREGIMTMFSSIQQHSRVSGSFYEMVHLETRLFHQGLNNTLSFSPFQNDEPFDQYLRLVQDAKLNLNSVVKNSDSKPVTCLEINTIKNPDPILCIITWDENSIKHYSDVKIDILDIVLLFDDFELFESLLRSVRITDSIKYYIVPLMENYNRVRTSIDCSAHHCPIKFASQITSCFKESTGHGSNRDFLLNLTNYHPDTSTNNEGNTRCQNCFIKTYRPSFSIKAPSHYKIYTQIKTIANNVNETSSISERVMSSIPETQIINMDEDEENTRLLWPLKNNHSMGRSHSKHQGKL